MDSDQYSPFGNDIQPPSSPSQISYFSLFGAIPETGNLTQSVGDTKQGYEFFCKYIIKQGGFKIFHLNTTPVLDQDGNTATFAFNCSFEDNESNDENNMEIIEQKLTADNVDFYVGSDPKFEPQQGDLINQKNKMIMQCCVGPDHLYENKNVFGVQVSNARYTELFIKQLSLRNINSVAIISNHHAFESSTCRQAEKYGQGFELNMTLFPEISDDISRNQTIQNYIQEIKNNRTEVVLSCVRFDDAIFIMEEIDRLKIPLKSIFFTVWPTKPKFINETNVIKQDLSKYILSAGQWHHEINYQDEYINDTQTYVQLFQDQYQQQQPTYTSAGASTVIEYYMHTIQNAFIDCDISATNGDVKKLLYDKNSINCSEIFSEKLTGYEIILKKMTMQKESLQTLFGEIKLNQFGRNVAMDPVTTQILSQEDGDLTTESVLPAIYASARIQMPQDNRYKVECGEGYYQPEDQFDECRPCEKGYYKCEDCNQCNICDVQYYNDEEGQEECKECPENSHTLQRGSTSIEDCQCEPGFFEDPEDTNLVCLECPENGGNCAGGKNATLEPLPGFWMDVLNSSTVHKCSPERVCLGGPESKCIQGYKGKLCADCADDYYSVFGECKKCPGNEVYIIMQVIGIVIAWWIINTVMSRHMETFDVILSWAQLLSVVGSYDMNWPKNIFAILNYASLFAFEVDIIDLSCMLQSQEYYDNFFVQYIVQLAMPIVVAILSVLSYLVSYFFYNTHKVDKTNLGNSLRSHSFTDHIPSWKQYIYDQIYKGIKNILQIFFILPQTQEKLQQAKNFAIAVPLSFISISYLTLLKYSFDSFKCIDFDGDFVMKGHIDIECNTPEYEKIQILGIIGLVLYVIPFPILCFVILRYLKNKKAFHIQNNLEQFGWLYNRYEVEWYWYELTQIFHRTVFVLVLVFVDSVPMQAAISMLVTIGLLMLHIYSRPYMDVILDILHTFLQVALMLLILAGLIFFYTEVNADEYKIVECFILLTLGGFGIIFAGFLFKNIYEILLFKYMSYRVKSMIGGMAERMGDLDDVKELLRTFEVGFLRHWIWQASDEDVKALHQLSQYLAENVADKSGTSYLSLTKTGRWWRYLSQRFPEVVDFLAVADENSRKNFVGFVEVLYNYFFKFKGGNNIHNIIRREDQAAVAQWLTISPPHARKAFNQVVGSMFLYAKGKHIARDHQVRVVMGGKIQNQIKQRDSQNQALGGLKHVSRVWNIVKQLINTKEADSDPVEGSQASTSQQDNVIELGDLDQIPITPFNSLLDSDNPILFQINIESAVQKMLVQEELKKVLEDQNDSRHVQNVERSMDSDSRELLQGITRQQQFRLLHKSTSSIHTSNSSINYLNDRCGKGPWENTQNQKAD